MKLYIWPDFDTDYTPGLAVAVAESLEQAREMVKAEIRKFSGGHAQYMCNEIDLTEPEERSIPAATFCSGGA